MKWRIRRLLGVRLKIRFTVPPWPKSKGGGWATWIKRYYIRIDRRGVFVRSQWQPVHFTDYKYPLQTAWPCTNCGFYLRMDARSILRTIAFPPAALIGWEAGGLPDQGSKGVAAICPYCFEFPRPRYRWQFPVWEAQLDGTLKVSIHYLPPRPSREDGPGTKLTRYIKQFLTGLFGEP